MSAPGRALGPGWHVHKPAQPKVEERARAGEVYRDDIIERYLHTVALTVALGWQL